MDKAEYLDPEKNLINFQNYKLNKHKINKNGTVRWRCETCKSMSITVNSDGYIVRKPKPDENHIIDKCLRMFPIQILCIKEYETLKNEAKSHLNFTFSQRYRSILQELQAKNDPIQVAIYFPTEETARGTFSKIRAKLYSNEAKDTANLDIPDELKSIAVNREKQAFLRFDNQNKNGDRIILFLSETAAEILQKSQEYPIDGTTIPCGYIFLENNTTKSYVIALEQVRNLTFQKNLERVMCDFEPALLKSIHSVFPGINLKGCWFHFTQAIRKKIFLFGYKNIYLHNYKFKFWIKRFMALALIPLENIKNGIDIIVEEIPEKDEKLIEFIKYFKKQWLNGSISPEIWNHHFSQKRTNNNLEGFHSKLTNFIPKCHPRFSKMLKNPYKDFDFVGDLDAKFKQMQEVYILKASSIENTINDVLSNCDEKKRKKILIMQIIKKIKLDEEIQSEAVESNKYELSNQQSTPVIITMIKISEKSLVELLEPNVKADNIGRIVVGGVITNEKGEVLILKRSANDFLRCLDELPSGKMDKEDKTIVSALKREIKEDTNLNVTSVLAYLNSFDYKSKSGKNKRKFNFLVGVSDLTQVQISEEHQAMAWYSMFNMNKSNMSSTVRDILLKFFQNQLIEHAEREKITRFVVGGVITNKNKQVLVLKRAANDFLGGLDELPSGKVENGEDLIEALKREIKEETNLNVVSVIRYLGHFDYKSKSGALTRQFNYEVSTDSIENLKLSEEHEKADWVSNSINAFKKLNVSINVREIIEKYFEDDEELIEEKKPSKRKVVETGNSNNKTKRL
ncbi:unnamed protein product [Brachionus calyciflorus]|uniref:8-oxo-dGTP diphosphatase n=1 Tax=Brachionus calyciflorus TaxID=104777 RepID=A0A813Z6D4_9BILA|nr:unnamed protein product [Brachionus calyciflorus]